MRRIFIFVTFVILLTGCSSIVSREELTLKEKDNLVILVENIKKELQIGDTHLLEESFAPTIKNNFVKKEIQNIDFSKINIFTSKPIFKENEASNIIGFNVQSMTVYYDVEYFFKDGNWKIVKFKERRG